MSFAARPRFARLHCLSAAIAVCFPLSLQAAELISYSQAERSKRADGEVVSKLQGRINFDALATLPRFSQITLTLPSGQKAQVLAERMDAGLSGAQTWVGRLTPNVENYRVYVTRSANGDVSGSIETPTGALSIQPSGAGGAVNIIDFTDAGNWTPVPMDELDGAYPFPDVVEAEAGKSAHAGHSHGHESNAAQPAWIQSVIKQAAADYAKADQSKAAPSPIATIDLLVVTTPAFAAKHGSNAAARIDQLVAQTNQAMIDSDVAIRIRLVGVRETTYSDTTANTTALNEITGVGARPATLANVPTWRNETGADLVMMLRPFNRAGNVNCGQAWITGSGVRSAAGDSNYGYSVVSEGADSAGSGVYCEDTTFSHEIGHNLGLMHDRKNVQTARINAGCAIAADALDQCHTYGAQYYAFGATLPGATGTKGTIMSTVRPRLNRYSNAAQFNCDGVQCGVPHPKADSCDVNTDADKCRDPLHLSADEARAMNLARATVSGFRATVNTTVPTPTAAPTPAPTPAPTVAPTPAPTAAPTPAPTAAPTPAPTPAPTAAPTPAPTAAPTPAPTAAPTPAPTAAPTPAPTPAPTAAPTPAPTAAPTPAPTPAPTAAPTPAPTAAPTPAPTVAPTPAPTPAPTAAPAPTPVASNRAPVAVADRFYVARDVVGQFLNLLANDTDADGDTLRVTSVTCQTGTVLISNGQAYYTPTAANRGFDICNYSIADGKGGVANSRATLYIR
jgi:Metallo-peptidase family M12B Reprolysin-like/Bacterial Ig domain